MNSAFAARRARLMGEMGADSLLVLPGAVLRRRNGDVDYRFRQDSDFWYLTGFNEPDALLVLAPGREQPMTLFVRPRDKEREIWDGRRTGVEGATERYGADEAFPVAEIDTRLPRMIEGASDLYYPLGRDVGWDAKVTAWVEQARARERRGTSAPRRILDPRDAIAEMRIRKEPTERDLLLRAARITEAGHRAAMRNARPGVWEYEIEADIEHAFRRGGASGPGYGSIVGSGVNATILHYIENNAQLREGQLLLVDAGAEFEHYTADVTRTVPVGGRWSSAARRVYDAVLDSQLAAIAMVAPGTTLDAIHDRAVEVLVDHLCRMKILDEPPAEAIERGTYKPFYMHRTSHWLGIDVHDAGRYRAGGEARPLEPDFVLTIEPGLYFAEDAEKIPDEYRGIGVRIEDDVLVTGKGGEVLTADIPKRPDELEGVVAKG